MSARTFQSLFFAKWQQLFIPSYYRHRPWVIAWWSAAFPGMGHLLVNHYIRGYIFVIWEIYINNRTHLNEAMVDTFTGHFHHAEMILDLRWMGLYIPVYLFLIYDGYRICRIKNTSPVSPLRYWWNNQLTEDIVRIAHESSLKKKPLVAAMWSCFLPGLGHIYAKKMISAVFFISLWILTVYHSEALHIFHATLLGHYSKIITLNEKQWLLFLPSIYFFCIYDSFIKVKERQMCDSMDVNHWLEKQPETHNISIKEGY